MGLIKNNIVFLPEKTGAFWLFKMLTKMRCNVIFYLGNNPYYDVDRMKILNNQVSKEQMQFMHKRLAIKKN